MTSLQIRCPFCDSGPLLTPESLVEHLASLHHQTLGVATARFNDRESFESWLNRVEESRQDAGSSYIPSSQADNEDDTSLNSEYYLLCAHHSQDPAKRRRVDRNGNIPSSAPILTCPAFVHVRHGDMGQIDVAYCLDHITPDDRRLEAPSSSFSSATSSLFSRGGKKRGSECLSMDCSSSPPPPQLPPPSQLASGGGGMSSVSLVPGSSVDFSPINEFISTRLDSTAMKLKNLTKVLAQLAVDIGACDRRPPQPVYA